VPYRRTGDVHVDSLQAPKLVTGSGTSKSSWCRYFLRCDELDEIFWERFDLRLDYFDSRVIQEKCIHLLKVVCAEDVVAVHDGEELEARIAK
jgi:hypothetical protein